MFSITPKMALELAAHEGIVCEAYKDSVGVWTWGIGVTNASGHIVHPRYLDNPQPIERCLEIFEWLLRKVYLPPIEAAFAGHSLTEEQLGAALSFHYNTGGIARARWVTDWKSGNVKGAARSFMNWSKPPEIMSRRKKERDLFFSGVWSATSGRVPVYPVRKPSYQPDVTRAERIDIRPMLETAFAGVRA